MCDQYLSIITESNRSRTNSEIRVPERLMKDYKRWLCRNDLFFLACITGQDRIVKWWTFYRPFLDEASLQTWKVVQLGIHAPSEMMLRIKDVTNDPKKDLVLQRMYLKYRTFYKTTIITKLKSLQLLLNFNNIHLVLCHNKEKNAADNLMSVKNMFLTKPVLSKTILIALKEHYSISHPSCIKDLFPECIPISKDWGTMTAFSVANRTDWSRGEDNIEAVGVDTEITGRHWQVAIKNDLVTEKSVNTEEQIKKTMSWNDRFNQGLFDDPQFPLQDYEGTRYHFADLYSKLKNDSDIKLEETPLIKDLDKFKSGEDNQIIHPERFDRDAVEKMMSKDMWIFMTQMMMKPEDPEKMQFKREMIRYFRVVPQGCNYYLLIDPASVAKKGSDYTVMKVIGIIKDQRGQTRRYFVDGIRDKLNPKQRVDQAIELAEKWSVKDIAWEAMIFAETDTFYFEERRRLTSLKVIPTLIKSHGSRKEDRIRGLVPEYTTGGWLWPEKGKLVKQSIHSGKNYDLTEEMEHEFLQFPLAGHDDMLDADTFLNRLNYTAPNIPEQEEEDQGMTFGDYHKLMEEAVKDPWNVPRPSRV